MGFCLELNSVRLAGVLWMVGAGIAFASNPAIPPSERIRTVVRADARSGRLVRAVVAAPPARPAMALPVQGSAPASASIPELVEKTALKYEVDPLLVHSVIEVESNYNPNALSPKGAQGLMQLMPGTARRFGVRNSFDVKENIEGGVRYLRFLSDLFSQDKQLAVAAYNAGEGAVWKYNNSVPPYRETVQYVDKVGRKYGKAKREAELQKARQKPASQPETAPAQPAEAAYAHVEEFIDAQGRLYLRTAASVPGEASTP